MTTGEIIVDVRQGNTRTIAVTITDEDGNGVDLSGVDAEYVVSEPYDEDEAAVVTKTDASGIDYPDPTSGELEIRLDTDDTDLDPRRYRHELKLDGADWTVTAFVGALRILDSHFVDD